MINSADRIGNIDPFLRIALVQALYKFVFDQVVIDKFLAAQNNRKVNAEIRKRMIADERLKILDPAGHRIEIYCSDYQTVDPDLEPIKWDLKDPQRQTLWGAPAPRSWFELGSVFDGADLVDSDLTSQPIIAP